MNRAGTCHPSGWKELLPIGMDRTRLKEPWVTDPGHPLARFPPELARVHGALLTCGADADDDEVEVVGHGDLTLADCG